MNEFKFILSEPHPCEYLAEQSAQSAFLISNNNDYNQSYSLLIQHGFRRSGDQMYRPHCSQCDACTPVRIHTADFKPSRIQRRTWIKNSDLLVTEKPARFEQAHYELYLRYQNIRHSGGNMAQSSQDEYIQFLSSPWSDTRFYEFSLESQIVAVAVVDYFEDALSSVYTFFDPEMKNRSLGSYAILWEIELARRASKSLLYLGYWIPSCRKMSYKNQYKPTEAYKNGRWGLIEPG